MNGIMSVDNCSKSPPPPTFRGLSAESIDPVDKPRGVGCGLNCQRTLISGLLIFFNIFLWQLSFAGQSPQEEPFLSTNIQFSNWMFAGLVSNDSGDFYGYFFRLIKNAEKYHTTAAVLDAQSRKIIVQNIVEGQVNTNKVHHWDIGNAFLGFNPVNDRWSFGVKNNKQQGFQFKVDTLTIPERIPVTQKLCSGVELLIGQTNLVNGDLTLENSKEEQFVTGKNAWFRRIWLADKATIPYNFSGILCQFTDGSGFYSIKNSNPDAIRGVVSGAVNTMGMSEVMSQFIDVRADEEGTWHIRMILPRLHLVLSNAVKVESVIAGFVFKGDKLGFCLLDEAVLGNNGVA